ncbi:MAG: hypothetical protein UT11_C0005G0038 [Berkelbacteria bacterium GW2011_GWA2_38_9]|uniref:Uncharacterized protein n=1 Tax=Berkelbacteria bacterium GW2011_GWA2_38_9 TaxID=1618334 RepID=A0A0G0LHF7_9BACT|nr:MAG: hypothetical protein UT11_C0005G0038 [Berkelbacteria bacterium GW2011_GWA2_38_9]
MVNIKETASKLKSEIKKNILTAVLAAFGLIIALVWRDAIQAIINEIVSRVGINGSGYVYQTTTAAVITIICVLGILLFSRLKGEEDVKK